MPSGGRRSRVERDAAFRRAVDEAKTRYNISDIVGRRVKLTKAGPLERKGLCPFHQERSPSLQTNDAKGTFHCFGCGSSGDLVDYVMRTERLDFLGAMRFLSAEIPQIDPAERLKAIAEDEEIRARAIDDARNMWGASQPITGTLGETYLRRVRAIRMDLPPAVRFGMVPTGRDAETGEWKPGRYPAVILAATDAAGELVGLQRIFVSDDGSGKRWGKRSKLSLGRLKSSAVKLTATGAAWDPSEVIVCEGPEDGLTLAQEMPDRTVWVALGTSMMPEIEYPASVHRVVLAGDNNDAGRAAVQKAAAELERRGLDVGLMFPRPEFSDFNDQLRGVRR